MTFLGFSSVGSAGTPIQSAENHLAETLELQQYSRYAMYLSHVRFAVDELPAARPAIRRVIEFGGSNGFIAGLFDPSVYEVAPNAPKVDLHDLSAYPDATYDVVVLDEILEHSGDMCVPEDVPPAQAEDFASAEPIHDEDQERRVFGITLTDVEEGPCVCDRPWFEG